MNQGIGRDGTKRVGFWRKTTVWGIMGLLSLCSSLLPLPVQSQEMDTDADQIPDTLENLLGLNPADHTDAAQDQDGDRSSSLEETQFLSDPFLPDSDYDGLRDARDPNRMSSAIFYWGRAALTSGDQYAYLLPTWVEQAFKNNGAWRKNSWFVKAGKSRSLTIRLEPTHLPPAPGHFRIDLAHADIPGGSISIDLEDDNGNSISDLQPGIVTGTDAHKVTSIHLNREDLIAFPNLLIQASGPAQIFETVIRPETSENYLLYPLPEPLVGFCEDTGIGLLHPVFAGMEPVVKLKIPTNNQLGARKKSISFPSRNTSKLLSLISEASPDVTTLRLMSDGKFETYTPLNPLATCSTFPDVQEHLRCDADQFISQVTVPSPSGSLHWFRPLANQDWWSPNLDPTTCDDIPFENLCDDLGSFRRYTDLDCLNSGTPASECTLDVLPSLELFQPQGSIGPCFDPPPTNDSDQDGLPDDWEVQYNLDPDDNSGSNGANGDSDGDGLTNEQEFQLGTNPTAADTDGDGFNDDEEIAMGTNPNAPTCNATPEQAGLSLLTAIAQ